jgi:hypothetical protein
VPRAGWECRLFYWRRRTIFFAIGTIGVSSVFGLSSNKIIESAGEDALREVFCSYKKHSS